MLRPLRTMRDLAFPVLAGLLLTGPGLTGPHLTGPDLPGLRRAGPAGTGLGLAG
jgi:hypothetical protein